MSSPGIDSSQLTLSAFSFKVSSTTGITSNLLGGANTTSAVDSDGDNDGSTGSAASVKVSKRAQLFSQLQKLQQQDPTRFKQVLTDAATKLQDAAKTATGDQQKFLTNLADKFQQAANGNLSALQPPSPPGNNTTALYAQNSPTTDPVAQVTQQATSQLTQQTQGTGKSGHHHHHGGGSSSENSSTSQALANVFEALQKAVSTITDTPSSTASTTSTAA